MPLNFAQDQGGSGQSTIDASHGYDAITLQSMLESLPKIQQAQRRAEQMRGAQQYFQQMQQQPGNGNFVKPQMGGLYQTVAQWQPDYAKAGNEISGALGQLYSNKQGNAAEDTYNAARNQQILQGIQQASSGAGGSSGFGSGNLWPGQGTGWLGQG